MSSKKTMTVKPSGKIERWHFVSLFLVLYDLLTVTGSYLAMLALRYDFQFAAIPSAYLDVWKSSAPIYAVFCLIVFSKLRLYRSLWRFASYSELKQIIISWCITTVFYWGAVALFFDTMPLSYYIGGALGQFILIPAVRFAYRFLRLEKEKKQKDRESPNASRVMLIGGGSTGQVIIRELHQAPKVTEKVCCIIDDDTNKWGRFIEDVPIVGGREDILKNVEAYKIDKIFFAIPSASAEDRRDVLTICNETGCKLKTLPGVYQLMNGEVNLGHLKNVDVVDLLGRKQIEVNMDEIFTFLSGKVILVTGGGGSIGSELCRQIAKHHPKQLIILDIYENSAHAIQLELKDNHPDLNLQVLIGSVRDSSRLDYIFRTYRPEVVYHAAAHKHVPLMEASPCEAVKNNAIGTYKTAYAAMLYGCKRFVLISTDKAVNPTNIMGATKRLCEMAIQSLDRKIKEGCVDELPCLRMRERSKKSLGGEMIQPVTEFVAVRFGNVLGSNGSVIPRFKEQIAKGGPVTVTHPDIIRYFMTIPEAASLVLQAGTYAKGGEIFVLDMGEPVKIDMLARNLIKLSGLRPDIDIKISYTGLRPGEKLFEEKLMSEEGMKTTPNHLIHIGCPIPFDADEFFVQLEELMEVAYDENVEAIKGKVAEIVTTYRPQQ